MKWPKNIILVTIPSLLFVLLFLNFVIFRYILPATELPYVYFDVNDQILKFDNTNGRITGLYTYGPLAHDRTYWHINNFGWNSDINYSPTHNYKPLMAIIGDSFIEALNVNLKDNITAKMREKVKDTYEVYSFGISGAPLSQYLQMSRYVNKYFKPKILIFNVVHNDFDESLCSVRPLEGMLCLECEDAEVKESVITPYVPNELKRSFRSINLVRYLWNNLSLGPRLTLLKAAPRVYNANIDVQSVYAQRDNIRRAVDYILDTVKQENGDKTVIFMMDAPRNDLYNNKIKESNVFWMNILLESACKKYDFYFLDLTAPFIRDFQLHHVKFESPYDNHWNEYGHQKAAEALFHKLQELGLSRATGN